MTCIVGIVGHGKVWIGGDSCNSNGNAYSLTEENAKVFRVGPMLVGTSGSPRAMQLMRYCLEYPNIKKASNPIAYLVKDLANPLRGLFKEQGIVTKDENNASMGDVSNFTMLIGLSGRLFHFYTNFQITEHADEFGAMGSGTDLALGALSVLPTDMPAEQRVRLALEAAARFDIKVNPPFVIQSL